MRIYLGPTNAPWVGTGYGMQAANFIRAARAAGHDVAIGAISGWSGAITSWGGATIYPAGRDTHGNDITPWNVRHFNADLVITLYDAHVFHPELPRLCGVPFACWMPVDTETLSWMDRTFLEASGARPVAMSQHGRRALAAAGFGNALYVPHAIDTAVFAPLPPVEEREYFCVGICAANKDTVRKAWFDQIPAFARLHRKHPDTRLLIHSAVFGGVDLEALTGEHGIKALFADQYEYMAGITAPHHLAAWYSMLDVLSNASYAEGFGLPVLEAQACGVPVIVTKGSAMTELCGAGWTVPGEPLPNPEHRADWVKPSRDKLAATLIRAYEHPEVLAAKAAKARAFALAYDIDRVWADYWAPALKELVS